MSVEHIVGKTVTSVLQSPWDTDDEIETCEVFVTLEKTGTIELTLLEIGAPITEVIAPNNCIPAEFREDLAGDAPSSEHVLHHQVVEVVFDVRRNWQSFGLLMDTGYFLFVGNYCSSIWWVGAVASLPLPTDELGDYLSWDGRVLEWSQS